MQLRHLASVKKDKDLGVKQLDTTTFCKVSALIVDQECDPWEKELQSIYPNWEGLYP